MELLSTLLILLVFSRVLGAALARLGNPVVVGEIIAGIILGPTILGWASPSAELSGISELAMFLIIFSAAMEMEVHEVITAMKGKGLPLALLGFFMPVGMGILIGYLFQLDLIQVALVGLCLAITALPVALRLLEGMKLNDKPIAHQAVGAIIIIDVLALLALGIILDLGNASSVSQVLRSLVLNGFKMFGFFSLVLLVDWVLTRKLKTKRIQRSIDRLLPKIGGRDALFGFAALFVLLFSFITERMGFHAVIGAFFGGLLISKDFIGKKTFEHIQGSLVSITQGFLAPLFFAYIGLQFSLSAFTEPEFLMSILFFGILGKTLAGWLGGWITGSDPQESLAFGVVMNGRGVMDLVVAEIAYEHGVMSVGLFSSFVILSIVSTMVAPLIYQVFSPKQANTPKKIRKKIA